MNAQEARILIVAELGNIAPEADYNRLDPKANLREALDIDSLDFLNFITALHKKTGVSVPESDYRKLLTLEGAVKYLMDRAK